MIQKNSILNVLDINGVFVVKCFHTYKKFNKNTSSSGLVFKSSIKLYSKLRKKWKGKKTKSIVVVSRSRYKKPDGSFIYGNKNSCVLLKKRLSIRGKLTKGYNFYNLKKKKFINSFSLVIYVKKSIQ